MAGEDRCCGDSCGTGLSEAELTEGNDNFARNLYYDTGAMAIAFAVKRASSTSAKFWTSKTEGTGFWVGRCTCPQVDPQVDRVWCQRLKRKNVPLLSN